MSPIAYEPGTADVSLLEFFFFMVTTGAEGRELEERRRKKERKEGKNQASSLSSLSLSLSLALLLSLSFSLSPGDRKRSKQAKHKHNQRIDNGIDFCLISNTQTFLARSTHDSGLLKGLRGLHEVKTSLIRRRSIHRPSQTHFVPKNP